MDSDTPHVYGGWSSDNLELILRYYFLRYYFAVLISRYPISRLHIYHASLISPLRVCQDEFLPKIIKAQIKEKEYTATLAPHEQTSPFAV